MPKTPQKSKNKVSGSVRWDKYGPYAAQLFRDLYFGKYTRKENGKFDTASIYNDPTRKYHKLSKHSFYKRVEEIDERVQAYKTNGTGLGTADFRQLVNVKRIPPPEDRSPDFPVPSIDEDDDEEEEESESEEEESEEESEVNEQDRALSSSDSEDSTYFGANEPDVELDADFEEEEEQEEVMPPKKRVSEPKKKKMPKKTSKNPSDDVMKEVEAALKKVHLGNDESSFDTKYMYKLADGRICCVFQLTSGFDGNFEFNPGKVKTKIMLKRIMPRWSYDAKKVFRRKAFNNNNANIVELQTLMDKQRRDDIVAMGIGDPETYTGQVHRSRVVFDVSTVGVEEVLPYFLDENGNQTPDINADGGNTAGEWVYFWLRDKATVKEAHPVGRIVRNNTRGRDSMDSSDTIEAERPRARTSTGSDGATTYFYDATGGPNTIG